MFGRFVKSSVFLRRVILRARRVVLRVRVVSIILLITIFASVGFFSRYFVSSSFICCLIVDFILEEISLFLVWEENFGFGIFTETIVIRFLRVSLSVALILVFLL